MSKRNTIESNVGRHGLSFEPSKKPTLLEKLMAPFEPSSDGNMLELLDEVLKELPDLVGKDGPDWNSLRIDYDNPLVHRLWLPWRDKYRINLHKLFPCKPEDALWHPHSWPSAMIVVDGHYIMKQGQARNRNHRPKPSTTVVMSTGSSHEMVQQLSWHSVAPVRETLSVMVTGPLFKNKWTEDEMKKLNLPKLKHNLGGLSKKERDDLLTEFYFGLDRLRRSNGGSLFGWTD